MATATLATVSTTRAPARPRVSDILRDHGFAVCRTREQSRAVADILACRTAALGGQLERCPACSFSRTVFRSCCNRHCPNCQVLKQARWAEAQEARLLPTAHFQVVFTVADRPLRPFFRKSPRRSLSLLLQAVAETLSELTVSMRGIDAGFTMVLHTWNQKLDFYHPHVHCLVPAGGLSLDGEEWVSTSSDFFLPVDALASVFRGKLLASLESALRAGDVRLGLDEGLPLLRRAAGKPWKVYVKAPLAGPGHVVRYLSRYVHRIAIANSRIVSYDGTTVRFRYKDRADGGKVKTRSLSGPDFARAFLEHVLPARFVRIRHHGLLSSRRRTDLERARELIGGPPLAPPANDATWADAYRRLLGSDPLLCPHCHQAHMVLVATLPPVSP
jgi:hypothetical protein